LDGLDSLHGLDSLDGLDSLHGIGLQDFKKSKPMLFAAGLDAMLIFAAFLIYMHPQFLNNYMRKLLTN
jgi:hypothetical protein